VDAVLDGESAAVALAAEPGGYFAGTLADARAGTRYRFSLDGGPPLPDPASRFQPDGPHGASEIVDPGAFRWTDTAWPGVSLRGQVLYELHVGTFTREGTWRAAMQQLPVLADMGMTVLELMPVAEFPGQFGWGYDGVDLFAPTHLYGRPDDFRAFVDRAHALRFGVILDVVYNHVGPDGNYLTRFSPDYVTDRYANEWGEAINFDGARSAPVREFFIANAGYWIAEYHLDGLRLDATQQMFDVSPDHILAAISRRVRQAGGPRATLIVAENEPQHVRLVRSVEVGGYGLDALWNDDFHHSARVAVTGRHEAYYTDYGGTPQELVSAVKWGYLYQGQRYAWQKKARGTPAFGVSPERFVAYVQNHDQVANSGRGERLHQITSPGRWRAITALLLLAPATPMLFQGQEFSASSPFVFFADHAPELARLVQKGRAEFLAQFPGLATPEMRASLTDPADPAVFERCKLDHAERERHSDAVALHRDLLRLRRCDPVFSLQRAGGVDGAMLADGAFALRFFGEHTDRLLLVNLGRDVELTRAPEPLLAPPENAPWEILWSSEHPAYGGSGVRPLMPDAPWYLTAESATVLG
jgi:maltooligosyltrehalose trehalohydrolase